MTIEGAIETIEMLICLQQTAVTFIRVLDDVLIATSLQFFNNGVTVASLKVSYQFFLLFLGRFQLVIHIKLKE